MRLSSGTAASIGTALAYLVWFGGVTRLAPVRVSLLALLSPVVATMLGWIALDQALTPTQLLGALAALIAVVVGAITPRALVGPGAADLS